MAERRIKKNLKLHVSKAKQTNYEQYEESDLTPTAQTNKYLKIKTVHQLFEALQNPDNKDLDIEARVIVVEKGEGRATIVPMNKVSFVESFKKNSRLKKFKESIDYFAYDMEITSGNRVGDDYTPLLGGPFNKQLYLHDYLRMHSLCFQTYNHDPIAKAAIQIIRDFTIGRGWRVDIKDKKAQALWNSFEDVNNLHAMMDNYVMELSLYGEQMIWWLPNNQTQIEWQLMKGQESLKGILPRVRLMDPSVIWEIITYPEDINRVIAYVWCAPTQYQMYTAKDGGQPVAGTKFIFQQIPADQVDHYKINSVSNEKRGRSDLFPVLGYMKRLRDSVNYSIIGLQKATAWSIDTAVDGAQSDIDAYISSQEQLGTIPPAGSEFVHSKKIERKYMSNEGAARGQSSTAFDWTFSMICAGLGIPVNYFGTHLSGGQTRASAVVATEPVTKKFEARRKMVEEALTKMAKRLFKQFGMDNVEIEVSFPELITQDRSAKLKDLAMAVQLGWISNERAAEIAAKELDITKFNWETEQNTIQNEKGQGEMPVQPDQSNPLTAPPKAMASGADNYDKSSSLNSQDRKAAKSNYGN